MFSKNFWLIGVAVIAGFVASSLAHSFGLIGPDAYEVAVESGRYVASQVAQVRHANDELEVPFSVAMSNRDNANLIDQMVVPDSIYDISMWAYSDEFAQRMEMPEGLIYTSEAFPDEVEALNFSVFTSGVRNVCRVGLLLKEGVRLALPDGEWINPRDRLVRLLTIERETRETDWQGSGRWEEVRRALPDKDNSFSKLVGYQGGYVAGQPPDGQVSVRLALATDRLVPGLRYIEFSAYCSSFSAMVWGSLHNDVRLYLQIPRWLAYPSGAYIGHKDPSKPQSLLAEVPHSLISRIQDVLVELHKGRSARLKWRGTRYQILNQTDISPDSAR